MPPSFLIASLALLIQTPSATLKYDMPEGWTSKPLSSKMRLADFVLPKAEGDTEDASLVVTFFGGQGGSVQANIDRWLTQVAPPDGRASKDVAKTSNFQTNDLVLTIIDLPGTLVAEIAPGSTERYNKPGFHLRAAVIEGKGGPFFVRLVGPAKTVAKWDASVQAFFKSLRVE
jgi:hypothetical protein